MLIISTIQQQQQRRKNWYIQHVMHKHPEVIICHGKQFKIWLNRKNIHETKVAQYFTLYSNRTNRLYYVKLNLHWSSIIQSVSSGHPDRCSWVYSHRLCTNNQSQLPQRGGWSWANLWVQPSESLVRTSWFNNWLQSNLISSVETLHSDLKALQLKSSFQSDDSPSCSSKREGMNNKINTKLKINK